MENRKNKGRKSKSARTEDPVEQSTPGAEDAAPPEEDTPVEEEESAADTVEEYSQPAHEEAELVALAEEPVTEATAHRRHGEGTEDRSSGFYRRYIRPLMSARLPMPISLLDRYILESLFTPFIIIFLGFTGIWIIFDLMDNLEDFLDAKVGIVDILLFYGTQLPQFALIGLQVSLLLAVLYSLSRLSRTHELVAMLSSGRSVPRILLPIFGIGLAASFVSIGLSYRLAPWASAEKEAQLQSLIRGEKRQPVLFGTLYRNRFDKRTWHIRRMTLSGMELSRVHILQQDAQGDIIYSLVTKSATYRPEKDEWYLDSVVLHFYDRDGKVKPEYRRYLTIRGWRETPKLIVSSNQKPDLMGVPELRQYLLDNRDFPEQQLAPFRTFLYYRWAMPWTCMAVVLFGAPLGMAFSRGGIMSNIATAIFLFITLFLGQEVFLALGKGARLDPWIAAWMPNMAFGLIGLYLLGLRAANRDLPKFNLYGLYSAITSASGKK